jgi:hypothetical protein
MVKTQPCQLLNGAGECTIKRKDECPKKRLKGTKTIFCHRVPVITNAV